MTLLTTCIRANHRLAQSQLTHGVPVKAWRLVAIVVALSPTAPAFGADGYHLLQHIAVTTMPIGAEAGEPINNRFFGVISAGIVCVQTR